MSKLNSPFPKAIYLSHAFRTPIGRLGGSLKSLSAAELAANSLKSASQKYLETRGEAKFDFLMMGHARQAGAGPNPARQAAIAAGLGDHLVSQTINQACASGLASIISCVEKVALGRAENAWAGGVESMSNTPYLLMQARWGQKMGHGEVTDGMRKDGFFCPMSQMLMGETVENFLVPEFQISREEQDRFALSSQQKAARAWEKGLFADEVLEIAASGKFSGLKTDEHLRADSTFESLQKLPAVFKEDGSISAGNSSGITDGAAFLNVSTIKDSHTLAQVMDYEMIALAPTHMGLGPVEATQRLLARHGLKVSDLEVVELNEAFAAQAIACQRTLKIPESKLNPRGGAIAIGHPIGCTGTRITVTLLHQLKGKTGALGLATLCVSGGMGVSLLVRAS